jgi:uncharacterized paraquat-inducible protein A
MTSTAPATVVTCPNCQQKNRVPAVVADGQHARCARCKCPLAQLQDDDDDDDDAQDDDDDDDAAAFKQFAAGGAR